MKKEDRFTCLYGAFVFAQISRQRESEEEREADDEEVADGVEIDELQIRDADCRDHTYEQNPRCPLSQNFPATDEQSVVERVEHSCERTCNRYSPRVGSRYVACVIAKGNHRIYLLFQA